MTSASPSNSRASISPTQSPDQSSRQSAADRLKNRKSDPNSIVYNLSSKILSPSELSVLELGLSFSPSSKPVDNDLLATDVFQFVRKLKLREYFEERNNEGSNVLEDIPSVDEDRDPMKWQERNLSWYPEKVRKNRSEGLSRWVDGILDCINGELTTNKSKLFNNLSNDQRQALKSLSKDSSITIKPADKGGAVVIMDSSDYEKACIDSLSINSHYEEVSDDPTATYIDKVSKIADDLHKQDLINDFEKATITKGTRTPLFYGLPKIHKVFTSFPALRPICSGSDGPTKYLSELVDSFLKPLARKSASFIRDSTDFICKTRSLDIPEDAFLVTMDVESLYTNIDQSEGTEFCAEALNSRRNSRFSTSIITGMIKTVLECNCMQFSNRFFRQIKGTAMGTPMAPNFANLFMTKFETDMLNAYEKEFQKRPLRWFRYIDDVFFVWTYDKTSLNHFIDFCNSYATRSKLRSSIRFTSEFSKSSVSFLDMIVRLENGRICTSVYSKPVDTHTYLHSTSFHSPSTIISLPKTQFIRIRRICSSIADFNLHASKFVEFFVRRGYKKSKLLLTVDEVAKMSREDLLASKPAVSSTEFPKRTVLSVLWHPRLQFLQRALHGTYKRFSTKYPSLKKTFPEPPLVAYRKNPTLSNSLVRARYGPKTVPDQFTLPATSTLLQKNMSTATRNQVLLFLLSAAMRR